MRVFALSLCLLTAAALAPPPRRLGKVTAQRSAAGEPAPQPYALDDARPRSAAALAALATAAAPLACYAAGPAWVEPVSNVLDPCFFLIQFIMLLRVIISWYPETDLNDMPWRIVTWPTEPVLKLTRAVVPPSFGVDVSPIVWIAVASFSRELLLGQQGVLILMMQRG